MATLKTIRKRIGSVKNTQKITKAMKMVAAAKLRRAQQAVSAIRPYTTRLENLVNDLRVSAPAHPVFATKTETGKKAVLLVFSSNKGLCGGFNSNLLKRSEIFIREKLAQGYATFDVIVIGKKGRDFFRARRRDVKDVWQSFADKMSSEEAAKIAQDWLAQYLDGTYDECWIAFNQFKSAIAQEPTMDCLLPFPVAESKEATYGVETICEPNKVELLEGLIPRLLGAQIYRAHRESLASELGSRMSAMENATNNAKEMIRLLTLDYNRLRQAVITTELMDIVNGAESIK